MQIACRRRISFFHVALVAGMICSAWLEKAAALLGCSPHCASCSGPFGRVCEQCDPGYSLTASRCRFDCSGCSDCDAYEGRCLRCEPGFELVGGLCTESNPDCRQLSHCRWCIGEAHCLECELGYGMWEGNGTACSPCNDNCATCSTSDCNSCLAGYVLMIGAQGLGCYSQYAMSNNMWLVLALCGLAPVVVGLLTLWCECALCSRPNERAASRRRRLPWAAYLTERGNGNEGDGGNDELSAPLLGGEENACAAEAASNCVLVVEPEGVIDLGVEDEA